MAPCLATIWLVNYLPGSGPITSYVYYRFDPLNQVARHRLGSVRGDRPLHEKHRHCGTSAALGISLHLLDLEGLFISIYVAGYMYIQYIQQSHVKLPLLHLPSFIMKYSLIVGLLAVAGANCKPTSHIESRTVDVESLHTVPEGWTAIGAPAAHRKLPFRIAVRSVSQNVNTNTCSCDNNGNSVAWTRPHYP